MQSHLPRIPWACHSWPPDVLWLASLLIDALRESFSPSHSWPLSWAELPVAWLYTSAWHSIRNIGLLLVVRRGEPVRSLLSSMGTGSSFFYTIVSFMLYTVHHKRGISKSARLARARAPANTMPCQRERAEHSSAQKHLILLCLGG